MPNTTETNLPSMEYTFDLSIKGEDTGRQFEGKFTYRRLTIRERADISLLHNRLKMSESSLSEDIDSLLYMIAYLKLGLKTSPKWWKDCKEGLELYDIAPITELFMKIQDFEIDWHKKVFPDVDEEKPEDKTANE